MGSRTEQSRSCLYFPDVLAGLRRVQRSEGYRVGHAKSTRAEDMHPHWNPEGLPFVTHHETHLVGVWMYAQPGLNRAKLPFWTTEEIVEWTRIWRRSSRV
jgi:hypothetical protein